MNLAKGTKMFKSENEFAEFAASINENMLVVVGSDSSMTDVLLSKQIEKLDALNLTLQRKKDTTLTFSNGDTQLTFKLPILRRSSSVKNLRKE